MNKTLLSFALMLPIGATMANQVVTDTYVTQYINYNEGSGRVYHKVAYQETSAMYDVDGKKFAQTLYGLVPAQDEQGNYLYEEGTGKPLYSNRYVINDCVYNYNEKGLLTNYVEGYNDFENSYDNQDRLIKKVCKSGSFLNYAIEYKYEDSATVPYEEEWSNVGGMMQRIIYDYDNHGNIIEKNEYELSYSTGLLYNYRRTSYSYDVDNKILYDTIVSFTENAIAQNGGHTEYIYNDKKQLVERKEYRKDIMTGLVGLDNSYVYTYNEEGSVIEMDQCAGVNNGSNSYFDHEHPLYMNNYTVATIDPSLVIKNFSMTDGTKAGEMNISIADVIAGAVGYQVSIDGSLLDTIFTETSFTISGMPRGEHSIRVAAVVPNAFCAYSDAQNFNIVLTLPTPTQFAACSYEVTDKMFNNWAVGLTWTAPDASTMPTGAVLESYSVVYVLNGETNVFAFATPTETSCQNSLYSGLGNYTFGIVAIYNMGSSDTIFFDLDLTDPSVCKTSNPFNYKKITSKGDVTTYLYEDASDYSTIIRKKSEITATQRLDYSYEYGTTIDTIKVWTLSEENNKPVEKLTQINTFKFNNATFCNEEYYYNIEEDGTLTPAGHKAYGEMQYIDEGKTAFYNVIYNVLGAPIAKEKGFTSNFSMDGAYEIEYYNIVNGRDVLAYKTTSGFEGKRIATDTTFYYTNGTVADVVTAVYSVSDAYHKDRTVQNLSTDYNKTYNEINITWEAPVRTEELTGYEIYVNGVAQEPVLMPFMTNYVCYEPNDGTYTFAVVPCYNELPSCVSATTIEVVTPLYVANTLKALKDSVDHTDTYYVLSKDIAPMVVTYSSADQRTAYAQDATGGILLAFGDGVEMPVAGNVITNVKGAMCCYGMTETHMTHLFDVKSFDIVSTDSIVSPTEVTTLSELNFTDLESMLVTVKNISFQDGKLYTSGSYMLQGNASVFAFGYFLDNDLSLDKTYDVTGHISYIMGFGSNSDAFEIHSASDIKITTGLTALKQIGMMVKGGVISAEGAKAITLYDAAGTELAHGTETVAIPNGNRVVIVKAEMNNGETVVAKYIY